MTGPKLRAPTPNATLAAKRSRKSAILAAIPTTTRAGLPVPQQLLLVSASVTFAADLVTKTRAVTPLL